MFTNIILFFMFSVVLIPTACFGYVSFKRLHDKVFLVGGLMCTVSYIYCCTNIFMWKENTWKTINIFHQIIKNLVKNFKPILLLSVEVIKLKIKLNIIERKNIRGKIIPLIIFLFYLLTNVFSCYIMYLQKEKWGD